MSEADAFVMAMLLIYGVPLAVWRLCGDRDAAPLVVVQILGGLALGPHAASAVLPHAFHTVFTPHVMTQLNGIASWAVILFVWVAGIELDLDGAWQHRRESLLTAGLALGAPLALGALAAAILSARPGWMGVQAARWQFDLATGMACAVTALPILVLFLDRLDLLHAPLGQRILRFASLDDIAIWLVLACILMDWTRIARQFLYLLGFGAAAWGMRATLPRLLPADRWAISLVFMLASACAADLAGLHYMVGAFLAGAVTDRATLGAGQVHRRRQEILVLLMPVFFLSTGLRTDWHAGGRAEFGAAALLLAAAAGGKLYQPP